MEGEENIAQQPISEVPTAEKPSTLKTVFDRIGKFITWFMTFFEEDNGKASTKRVIAWVLAFTLFKAITDAVEKNPIAEWDKANYYIITIKRGNNNWNKHFKILQ